jgi:hypothetical protein
MPTFPSPVPLPELQRYLKDTSTDPNVTTLLTLSLDTATERVYAYLDRDYTPNAAKMDIFFGNDSAYHFLRHTAGALTSWKYYDADGVETDPGTSYLKLFSNGKLIVSKEKKFPCGYEHRVGYTTPASLTCPETVKQVIIEIAAEIFEESKQGAGELRIHSNVYVTYYSLSERHREMLAAYRRMPV